MALTLLYGDAQDHLVVSDGTAAGTHILAPAGADPSGLAPQDITVLDGKFYFSGNDSTGRNGLWVSDGTAAGTVELSVTGASPLAGLEPRTITLIGNKLFFTGTRPVGSGSMPVGASLWVSDGTAAGTHPVGPIEGLNEQPSTIVPFAGGAAFIKNGSLWVSDGTDAGTHVLAATASLPASAHGSIVAFGTKLLFPVAVTFHDPRSGVDQLRTSIWVTDGTSAGTHVVDVQNALQPDSQPIPLIAWGNRAVFIGLVTSANPVGSAEHLFVTDGTTGGTIDLSVVLASFGNLGLGFGNAASYKPIVLDGKLLLNSSDAQGRTDLLLTDGTAAGTTIVEDPTSTILTTQSRNIGGTIYTFPVAAAALDPAATLYGDLRGRSVVDGTVNDDDITVYGASNVVHGNGGSDTITTGDGGYTRIDEGSIGDGATGLTETIALAGRGNRVSGGDEAFAITGGTGFTAVSLGGGTNSVRLGGTYNTVNVGLGTNVIDAGGGFSQVNVSGVVLNSSANDTVTFSGQHDRLSLDGSAGKYPASGHASVTGGTGYGTFDLGFFSGSLATGGLYNLVGVAAGSWTLAPGDGYDRIDLANNLFGVNAVTVALAGTHNTIDGVASSLVATGGTGYGRFLFDQENGLGGLAGAPLPAHSYSVTTDGLYNTFSLLDTNANTITTGSGGARVTITDPTVLLGPGESPPPLVFSTTHVTFGGTGNALVAADGPVVATGGTGGSSYLLGAGDDSVTTAGDRNSITLGAGHDTVSVAGDHTTIVLNGSNADLVLHGSNDAVFLKPGSSGTIEGPGAPNLRVTVSPGIGIETIANLLADPGTVIHLVGGAGGYTTQAQVLAALTPDGAGGTRLAVGTGAIDFAGLAPGALHLGLFAIG